MTERKKKKDNDSEDFDIDYLKLIKLFKEKGKKIAIEDLYSLFEYEPDNYCYITPTIMSDFIINYLKNKRIKSILDVWAKIGGIIYPVTNKFNLELSIAFERDKEIYEIGKELDYNLEIDWHLGDPLILLNNLDNNFDLITGDIPWYMNRIKQEFNLDGKKFEIIDRKDKLLILKSSLLLSPNGVGIFITNTSFTIQKNKRNVYSNLSKFGLYVDSIISLPSGTFTFTSVPGIIIIIRKKKPDKLFVGELSSNIKSNKFLINNLKSRKSGKIPQYGALVNKDEFHTFGALLNEYEIKSVVKNSGLISMSIKDIAKGINRPNKSIDNSFQDIPNSLYLPIIGKSPAKSSINELKLKPDNYIQIIIDPEKGNAEYISNFFNTELGLKIRESLARGAAIPKINKASLTESILYLPTIKIQSEVLHANRSIVELESQLNSFKSQVWEYPMSVKKVIRSIESLNKKESFINWLDKLPFPLASILWTYYTENKYKEKLSHLLHFFEALSEYNTTIMLSAYAADEKFYSKNSRYWIESDTKYLEWYKTPTFGNWNKLGRRLSKATRRFLDDKEEHIHCEKLFGNPTMDFFNLITNKKLYEILEKVAKYRNIWKGHGGIDSEIKSKEWLEPLEGDLINARNIIADNYSSSLLLIPKTNEYTDGIYYYQVEALMGRSYPFKKEAVETLSQMDSKKIYLLQKNQRTPIELLPLIKMTRSPETARNACYFYNRILDKKAHYVSYHYDDEPHLDLPINNIINTFEYFNPPKKITQQEKIASLTK